MASKRVRNRGPARKPKKPRTVVVKLKRAKGRG
jgi:hypothetical protein